MDKDIIHLNRGKHKRRDIPHWDYSESKQHITFRLSDSLSANQLLELKKQADNNPLLKRSYYLNRSIEEWVNRGMGTCILRIPEIAQAVVDSLYILNNKRYQLFHWVVMPNHVHVLLQLFPNTPMSIVLNSWKHFTSERFDEILLNFNNTNRFNADYIDRILNTFQGHYWMTDYWDVMIRNRRHFNLEAKYIAQNPVNAGLVQRPEDYPWSSFYKQS